MQSRALRLSPKEIPGRVSLLIDGAMLISRTNPHAAVMFEGPPVRRASPDEAAEHAEAMNPAPKTIAALFESEESALLHFAMGIVRRRFVAEELVQEAFLRFHK